MENGTACHLGVDFYSKDVNASHFVNPSHDNIKKRGNQPQVLGKKRNVLTHTHKNVFEGFQKKQYRTIVIQIMLALYAS
jgi:hypothetical protein